MKKLLLALVPTIIVLLLFGLGFLACYYVIGKVLDNEIQGEAKAFTLGRLLKDSPEKRSALASTYHDPGKALQMFDDISWAVPNIPTPFVGTAPTPGQHGNAHINSMQFRSAKELEMPKPEGTYRIFITGGSTAYGSGAPGDDQTIAGYLNAILTRQLTPVTKQKYEVFTMANRAWASTHERIAIENRLSELEPDMVISFSGVNDVHWGVRGRNVLWFRSYADEYYWSLIKRVFIITRQPPMPENTRIENPIAPALVAERLLKNVRISQFVLSEKKIDYVFALQPALAVTNKKLSSREKSSLKSEDYFRTCYGLFVKDLQNLHGENFQFVDLSGVFDGLDDQEEIFMDSYHFGDKGNEKIAESLFLQIKGRLLKQARPPP
ncbi:MAG: SGNH/GDSL hydrolase family protein [Propionivibrio sp.]|uniref:SGNH/GDSL hydrolase family protein n=1 Tax=Propionivibrio sp. TaxID=2212460 RepID=UPI001A479BC9|nr:SGNH/GDSL hydrolase family protein [Propionivibrio sp.]MBL8414629.1 SGNH/GDSL hydrolase family protein [Propionivibrio sp.]